MISVALKSAMVEPGNRRMTPVTLAIMPAPRRSYEVRCMNSGLQKGTLFSVRAATQLHACTDLVLSFVEGGQPNERLLKLRHRLQKLLLVEGLSDEVLVQVRLSA